MALKKRSGVSAEFSLASMTDIIFLLLLFFMLTSTLVKIEPFDLPRSDAKTVAPVNVIVTIKNTGVLAVNNQETQPAALQRAVASALAAVENKDDATVTIVAETGTSFNLVTKVMEAASANKARAILATQPRN
jgi:biopolymer transport protein ExbD